MNINDRDISIIKHIEDYCLQIDETVSRFGDDFETFDSDRIYINAISLCILQIGELVGILSDDFKNDNPTVPWKQIKQMRNIVAHRYGTVDTTVVWDVIKADIPELKEYCHKIAEHE